MNKSSIFSDSTNSDYFIVLKYFTRVISIPIRKINCFSDYKLLIFDESQNAKKQRKEFLNFHLSDSGQYKFISYYELLTFTTIFHKLIFILIYLPFLAVYFLLSLNKINKASYALIYEYLIVLNQLIFISSKNKFKKLFYFSIHRPEANLFSYFLAKKIPEILKIASDTPIFFWNSNLISDTLILCNYYQFEEINQIKSTISIKNIMLWGPENSSKLVPNSNNFIGLNTIGFYSTAAWLRLKKKKVSLVSQYTSDEENCLKYIINYIQQNNANVSLRIFLHPTEKKTNKSIVLNYYKNVIGDFSNFTIDFNENLSYNHFSEVNLGIAMHSSVLHERLYCGYKSIFYSKMHQFPLRNTLIEKITADSEAQLFRLIDKNFKISDHDFFVSNKIENYLHSNFN